MNDQEIYYQLVEEGLLSKESESISVNNLSDGLLEYLISEGIPNEIAMTRVNQIFN